jgi:hypothetical protein
MQLTCQCAKCTAKHGIPPYVDLPAPALTTTSTPLYQPATRPTYCPNCAKPRTYRTYDYADVLIQDYMGMTRQLAIDIIRQFNEWRESSFRNPVRNSQLDVIDYLTDRGHSKMLLRAYVTPLDVQCLDCGGQFTMLRGLVTSKQLPPVHCVWCASKNISTSQENTEEVAYLILAEKYQLPQNILEYLYKQYAAQARHSTFESYMNSEPILAIRNKLAPLSHVTA